MKDFFETLAALMIYVAVFALIQKMIRYCADTYGKKPPPKL